MRPSRVPATCLECGRCRPGSPWRATPDYNANAVREATIEYNEVKARGNKVGEMIPLDRMEAIAEAV